MTKAKKAGEQAEPTVDRRGTDRRDNDRRKQEAPVAVERRHGERRKVQRRRQIDPTTCERDYTAEEVEFMQAIDLYKRSSGRMFPTCSEILEVLRNLGYVKSLPQPPAPVAEVSATEGEGKPAAEEDAAEQA